MKKLNKSFWQNKEVLITGHTGFKGAWMTAALLEAGARVSGIALEPPTDPSLFRILNLAEKMGAHITRDIRNRSALVESFRDIQPEVVFHMAAQSLVRPSYDDPHGTYETNVMGTMNVLEAIRACGPVSAAIMVTSDKCYENFEWPWRYRENDPMGGYDPYSSSKACCEILTASYRNSFFKEAGARIASVRAGNVIGGGDWATDRIIPDIVRAISNDETLSVRYPRSVRPWQHVLDPLRGYALLAEKLTGDQADEFTSAWNFGPVMANEKPVQVLVESAARTFPELKYEFSRDKFLHEAGYLALDSSRAMRALEWEPGIDLDTALDMTFTWYQAWLAGEDINALTSRQIAQQMF